jgi:hypothetical protein
MTFNGAEVASSCRRAAAASVAVQERVRPSPQRRISRHSPRYEETKMADASAIPRSKSCVFNETKGENGRRWPFCLREPPEEWFESAGSMG